MGTVNYHSYTQVLSRHSNNIAIDGYAGLLLQTAFCQPCLAMVSCSQHPLWLVVWSRPHCGCFFQLLDKQLSCLCFLVAVTTPLRDTYDIPPKASQKPAISTSCQLCSYNAMALRLQSTCGANLALLQSNIRESQCLEYWYFSKYKCNNIASLGL